MANPVAYFEITSNDPARARAFYGDLFGWKAEPDESLGGYAMVDTGAGDTAIGGGIGASNEPGDTGIRIYIQVDDLEGYLEKAGKLGGTTVVPPTELPGDYGRFAVFTDPDGNQVGLWG